MIDVDGEVIPGLVISHNFIVIAIKAERRTSHYSREVENHRISSGINIIASWAEIRNHRYLRGILSSSLLERKRSTHRILRKIVINHRTVAICQAIRLGGIGRRDNHVKYHEHETSG